jgi:hypothetical protein
MTYTFGVVAIPAFVADGIPTGTIAARGLSLRVFDFWAFRASVARIGSVTPPEGTGPGRNRHLVRLRWAMMLALSEQRGWSTPQIGARLGGRDHTTVLSGLSEGRKLRCVDPEFAALCADVEFLA